MDPTGLDSFYTEGTAGVTLGQVDGAAGAVSFSQDSGVGDASASDPLGGVTAAYQSTSAARSGNVFTEFGNTLKDSAQSVQGVAKSASIFRNAFDTMKATVGSTVNALQGAGSSQGNAAAPATQVKTNRFAGQLLGSLGGNPTGGGSNNGMLLALAAVGALLLLHKHG